MLFVMRCHRLSRQVEEVSTRYIRQGPQRPEHPNRPAPASRWWSYHPCGPNRSGPLRDRFVCCSAGLYSPVS